MKELPTFYTISDAPFFPATVALLNSLRLSGNEGRLVILDRGLAAGQRKRLEAHADVVDVDVERPAGPYVYKAFPHLFGASGVLVLIDSDIIVTKSLDDVVELARQGRICVFADHRAHRTRWFAQWHDILALQAPLRRQTYCNSGFVAISTVHWPTFLPRWWDLCGRIPPEQVFSQVEEPFWAADQDAFSALLASEIPADAVEILPDHAEAYPDDQLRVKVDTRSLRCSLDGQPVTILHHTLGPKVWEPRGWLRLRLDAYVRLLPRLLFAPDVSLRLRTDEVPFWLRPGRAAAVAARALDSVHWALRAAVYATPGPMRQRLIGARNRIITSLRR
jgi:hypothetical protein